MIASRKRGADKRGLSKGMFETLEQRRLLSGNVTVALDPTTHVLNIVGDNQSNQVRIAHVALGDDRVIGLDGTTVNGGAAAPLSLASAIAVQIVMGNGDDEIHVVNAVPEIGVYGRPLSIDTGNGNDTVTFNRLAFVDISISTGNGDDSVALNNVAGIQNLVIDTGNGDDSVTLGGTPVGVQATDVTIDGQRGFDAISGISYVHILPGGSLDVLDVEVIA